MRTRMRRQRIQSIVTTPSSNTVIHQLQFMTHEERRKLPPAKGTIRLISSSAGYPSCIARFWNKDISLTEWINEFKDIHKQYTNNTISSVLYPPNYLNILQDIFIKNQHVRYLAYKVYRKWSQRVWMKRTQCNITLIDMEPFSEKDAIYLTDTKHHQIFRFHRGDMFKNLLTNIGSCDEMLPSPRHPTNPWTNEPLTFQQTISVCEQIIQNYAKKGKCPPLLFAAFCAADYNIRTFRHTNASMLAQHAITTYFSEITNDNMDVVEETIIQLLITAGCVFSEDAISKWIRTPITPLHTQWLSFVCDYTLYVNLRIQVRPHWYNYTYIRMDIRKLYDKSNSFREIVRPRNGGTSIPVAPVAALVPAPVAAVPVPATTAIAAYEEEAAVADATATVAAYGAIIQMYNPNQLLGIILSSEVEGTIADLIRQAQIIIDEQQEQQEQQEQ